MNTESEQVSAYRAEIERLQVRIKVLVGLLADCAGDKELIAELAEALAESNPSNRLLLRAREATR